MDNQLRSLMLSGAANRQTIIHFPNGEHSDITEGFYSGSLKLEEILCASENLNFGECNATKFEAQVSGLDDISNTIIYVYQKVAVGDELTNILLANSGNRIITHSGQNILVGRQADYILPLFYGRVDSAELQTDKINRSIIAYDELYFNGDKNCADWYTSFFESTDTHTLKAFRDSLFQFIGIEQGQAALVNDSMIIEENLSTTTLKFSDVIKAICQINGCFGHIDRSGVFQYIYLDTNNTTYDISDNYRSNDSMFEQYTVKKIDKVQVNSEEGDIGAIVGTGDNPYIIQGNFLIWGKGADDLNTIATNVFNVIKNVEYRPFSAQAIYSEPYITVGDILTLTTQRDNVQVKSYIFKNSLDFTQLFHQALESTGDEYRDEVVDDVNAEINQLKGKTLKITKNVEEFSVQVSQVTQDLTSVSGEVETLSTQYAQISLEVDNITLQVGEKVNVGEVSSQLSIETDQITISGNRFVVDSTNFQLTADGTMTCSSAYITGGSINVDTGGDDNSFITLSYKNTGRSCTLTPTYVRLGDSTSNITVGYNDISQTFGDSSFYLSAHELSLANAGTDFFFIKKASANIITDAYVNIESKSLTFNSTADDGRGATYINAQNMINMTVEGDGGEIVLETKGIAATIGLKSVGVLTIESESAITLSTEDDMYIEPTGDLAISCNEFIVNSSRIGFFGHSPNSQGEIRELTSNSPTTTEIRNTLRDTYGVLTRIGLATLV